MMAAMQRPILPQATQDMSDIDRYINYDQVATTSPSRSPASPYSKSTLLPNINRELTNATVVPSHPSSQQTFAAPSHQYAAYPQNNGLPTGALLDSIPGPRSAYFSSNYNQQYYGIQPNDNFAMTPADDLDFGFGAGYIGSQNDMDVDFSTSPQSQANQSADRLPLQKLKQRLSSRSIGKQSHGNNTIQPPYQAVLDARRQIQLSKNVSHVS